jgi:hypothetical protein
MLSDFDLAKQASEAGGRAAGIQIDSHGVRMHRLKRRMYLMFAGGRCRFPSWTRGHALLILERIHLWARKVIVLLLFCCFEYPLI